MTNDIPMFSCGVQLRIQQLKNSPETATILETAANGGGSSRWQVTHPGLIDGKGLAGLDADVHSSEKADGSLGEDNHCAVAERHRPTGPRAWLAMKLAAPEKIFGVQLAFRTEGDTDQGRNVKVQVGNSLNYNEDDPVCREIAQLAGTGLVDYWCDNVHEGQYVILSNDQSFLTICEAKIVISEKPDVASVSKLRNA